MSCVDDELLRVGHVNYPQLGNFASVEEIECIC